VGPQTKRLWLVHSWAASKLSPPRKEASPSTRAVAAVPRLTHLPQQLVAPAPVVLSLEQQQEVKQLQVPPLPRDARRLGRRCAAASRWACGRRPFHAAGPALARRLAATCL